MRTERALIFPHQLFDPHPAVARGRPVLLIEDSLFFGDPHHPLRFHKHKLILHRAAMKTYADRLVKAGHSVNYIDFTPGRALGDVLADHLPPEVRTLHAADPVDFLLEKRLHRFCAQRGIALVLHETPMFLTPPDWFNPWFDGRKRYFMADFYIAQRKRLNLLVDADGQPAGGRWSFDAENRKRWPVGATEPPHYRPTPTPAVSEAARYVDTHFPGHPGDSARFWFPTTHEEASDSLEHFLRFRFRGFGDYEDAISRDHGVLHHSVLTPALNCGLLTPRQVVDRSLAHAADRRIPLNDLEGFVRQVIGWREFMRIVYVREGVRMRLSNAWMHAGRLDARWYDGTTGLDPLDRVIRRVTETAFCHHIERLMVVGNAMLLAGLHPDEAYRWFMELFIDAYDWVMVPNVYGMSQYADGGLITTKPYISGSNYLRKMSDFPAGPWCETWDGLYWSFIGRHRDVFAANPRLSMMARQWDRMDEAKRKAHRRRARAFMADRP